MKAPIWGICWTVLCAVAAIEFGGKLQASEPGRTTAIGPSAAPLSRPIDGPANTLDYYAPATPALLKPTGGGSASAPVPVFATQLPTSAQPAPGSSQALRWPITAPSTPTSVPIAAMQIGGAANNLQAIDAQALPLTSDPVAGTPSNDDDTPADQPKPAKAEKAPKRNPWRSIQTAFRQLGDGRNDRPNPAPDEEVLRTRDTPPAFPEIQNRPPAPIDGGVPSGSGYYVPGAAAADAAAGQGMFPQGAGGAGSRQRTGFIAVAPAIGVPPTSNCGHCRTDGFGCNGGGYVETRFGPPIYGPVPYGPTVYLPTNPPYAQAAYGDGGYPGGPNGPPGAAGDNGFRNDGSCARCRGKGGCGPGCNGGCRCPNCGRKGSPFSSDVGSRGKATPCSYNNLGPSPACATCGGYGACGAGGNGACGPGGDGACGPGGDGAGIPGGCACGQAPVVKVRPDSCECQRLACCMCEPYPDCSNGCVDFCHSWIFHEDCCWLFSNHKCCAPGCGPYPYGGCKCCGCAECLPPPDLYFTAGALALRRDNDATGVDIINAGGLPLLNTGAFDFGWETGPAFMIGYRPTRIDAWEFSYFGLQDWDEQTTLAGVGLSLPGDLGLAVGPFDLVQVTYSSEIHNAEANYFWKHGCKRLTWMAGFRYFHLDEHLDFTTFTPNSSVYNVHTQNNLYGGQLGVRTGHCCSRFGWDATAKGGAFGNVESQRQFADLMGGPMMRNTRTQETHWAFIGEAAVNVKFYICKNWCATAGYHALFLEGAALAPNQLDFTNTSLSGTVLNYDGSVFFHGASVGIGCRW